MIDPLAQFAAIMVTWCIWYVLKADRYFATLLIGGALLTAIYAPIAAIVIFLSACEAAILVLILLRFDRQSNWRKYGIYVVLLNFLFVDLHGFAIEVIVSTVAISFSTIRIFMTAKQLLSARKVPAKKDVYWIFVAGFYLPALVIGPIFSALDIRAAAKSRDVSLGDLRNWRLILQGMVLAILINPACGIVIERTLDLGIPAPALAPVYFLQLFAAFWGQSLIAERTSILFGASLPQNFDAPWKARDIREFWARWHRSMAQFVMQYIFLPLSLKGVSPRLAIIFAFVFMGLWHNLGLGYFIWGLGHGIFLGNWPKKPIDPRYRQVVRAVTWLFVITMSYIANYGFK